MSIFGGGSVLVVHSTASKLMEEYPDLLTDAVITATVADQEVSNYVLLTYLNGFRAMSRKYYNYAKNGKFYLDLPQVSTNAIDTSGQPTQDAIALEQNTTQDNIIINTLSITSITYGNANTFAFEYLQENYPGYNAAENRFTYAPEASVYKLSKVTVLLPENNLKMKCTKVSGAGADEINLYEAGPDWDNTHYLVQYFFGDDPGEIKYFWSYDVTLEPGDPGYHPNMTENSSVFSESYYPIVPVRYNKQFTNDEEAENFDYEKYRQCKKILGYIGVDLDDLSESMAENESIDVIDDAYYMFAIDIYTEEENSVKYLFDHFTKLAEAAWIPDAATYQAGIDALEPPDPVTNSGGKANIEVNSLTIFEQNLWAKISFNYPEVAVVNGTMTKDYEIVYIYGEAIPHTTVVDNVTGRTFTDYQETSRVLFRKKLTETTFEQLTIHGLTHRTYVILVDDMKEIFRRIEDPDPTWEEEGRVNPRDGFFIPVDREVAAQFKGLSEDYLLYESMTLIVIAADEQELKWYQTGFWSGIITFIIMIVSIYFTGGALSSAYNAAAGSTTAFLKAVALNVAIGYVAGLLIKKIPGALGMVAAAAFMIITKGMTQKGGFQAFMNMSAVEIAKSFVSLVVSIAQMDASARQDLLREEYEDLLKTRKELREEAEALQSDTFPNGLLRTNLLGALRMPQIMSPYESVEEMYNRAIHEGNPGVLTMDFIEEFHSELLKLPEFVYGDDKSLT